MSIERARAHLRECGLEARVLEFEASSATVELAAAAVGCEPARIAKTMAFDVNGEPVLVVAAGDVKVNSAKFKAVFNSKAKMMPPGDLEAKVGHAVGGVCPFGVSAATKVYLDESLRRFATVFPAAGSANSAVELSLGELERCSRSCGWVDVCKLTAPSAGD